MPLSTLKSFLTYKPKEYNTFELLEETSEGTNNENLQQANDALNKEQNIKQSNKSVKESETGSQNNSFAKSYTENSYSTNITSVSYSIFENLKNIEKTFGTTDSSNVIIRKFKIAGAIDAFIAYIDSMTDKNFISNYTIRPLMSKNNFENFVSFENSKLLIDHINNNVISANEVQKLKDFSCITYEILGGNTALFIDKCDECIVISSRGFDKRSIDKPSTENVVFGSQEGFTENLRTNITIINRLIKNENLRTEMLKVGKTNKLNCAVMYMNGVTNSKVVDEVKRRINNIDADLVIGGGMLCQYIEDNPMMLFPQILITERPDRTAAFLVEGKVAIIAEGTPFANIAPATFYHIIQTSEDTMLRWQYGSFLRIIRILGVIFALFLPSIYISLTLFHQEAIPTELLMSISKAKEQVPFPTIIEILMLEISFEVIREGGIRVPGLIGQTLGIVGALILGQAAVSAGLVSPILIIVAAITGIGSFTMPNYSFGISLRILRFFFIIVSSILGFYGISIGIFIIGCIACSMKSFGVPFLSPVAPKCSSGNDLVLRAPIEKGKHRPDYLNAQDKTRKGEHPRGWEQNGDGENS